MITHPEHDADDDDDGCTPLTRRALLGGVVGAGLLTVGASAQNTAMADELSARSALWTGENIALRADAPKVYTRSQWNARSAKSAAKVVGRAPDHIVVHHTATANSSSRSVSHAFALSRKIQKFHMDKNGWSDVGQQLTISRGGHVMEGRNRSLRAIRAGDLAIGAHVADRNGSTIGIENEGTYNSAKVPERLWDSLVEVCAWLCEAYDLEPKAIVGHRDFNSTSCPGDELYSRLPALRKAVDSRLSGSSKADSENGGQENHLLPPLDHLL